MQPNMFPNPHGTEIVTPATAPVLPRRVMGATFDGIFVPAATDDPSALIVWAHGWGQDHRALRALVDGVSSIIPGARHLVLDLPGFGGTPPPPADWGTDMYAQATAQIIADLNPQGAPVVWVGHSFGGRVGVQLAARKYTPLGALVLIAGAGLKRQLTPLARLRRAWRQTIYRLAKILTPPDARDALRDRFGSADYRAAGPLRGLLVRVVNEDLAPLCPAITAPTLLLYGEEDTETPPEYGERFSRLIPAATLHCLPRQDHYSVLDGGRAVVIKKITEFLTPILQQRGSAC